MTTGGGPRPRTIVDVSAPLEHYLLPVPSDGDGVCAVCHSAVYDGYRVCFPCNQARNALGDLRLDAVSFVSLAPAGEQLARDLYTYKLTTVPAHLRMARRLGLLSRVRFAPGSRTSANRVASAQSAVASTQTVQPGSVASAQSASFIDANPAGSVGSTRTLPM